ncbi:DUF3006 domain-containing protein [Clostridium sp.]|uniref:DUF3006 domain-containing protein n=1 Tax=Clostridium sp. TaxID=1506 RepID=UPI00260E90B8|nr:DUF3006 domain-containing protein [Clostridium sp.]
MKVFKYIVDRIEGDYAILETENDTLINVNKNDIIGEVKEGEILIKKDNIYYIDKEETEDRKRVINDMLKGLWEE